METKDVIAALRTRRGLSQEQLAERLHVTRQAVSRWETGETVPDTETLKRLSAVLDVSINTLLGAPRKLVCQCCGMPLEDATMSREPDGTFNEAYCKWCYTDGKFVYGSLAPGTGARLSGGDAAEAGPLERKTVKPRTPLFPRRNGGAFCFARA